MKTYVDPIVGAVGVRDFTTAHVIRVLEPIWTTKTETASRIRSRIELILDFAAAHGHRDGPKPARWRGNVDAALARPSKVAEVRHHAALSIGRMPAFMERLRSAVLTAVIKSPGDRTPCRAN